MSRAIQLPAAWPGVPVILGGALGFRGAPVGPFLQDGLRVGPGAAAGVERAYLGQQLLSAMAQQGLRGLGNRPADADKDETDDDEFAYAFYERMHREH
jgi:hypothetical protein